MALSASRWSSVGPSLLAPRHFQSLARLQWVLAHCIYAYPVVFHAAATLSVHVPGSLVCFVRVGLVEPWKGLVVCWMKRELS